MLDIFSLSLSSISNQSNLLDLRSMNPLCAYVLLYNLDVSLMSVWLRSTEAGVLVSEVLLSLKGLLMQGAAMILVLFFLIKIAYFSVFRLSNLASG